MLADYIQSSTNELKVLQTMDSLPKTQAEAEFRRLPFPEKLAEIHRTSPHSMSGVMVILNPILTPEEEIALFGLGEWQEDAP